MTLAGGLHEFDGSGRSLARPPPVVPPPVVPAMSVVQAAAMEAAAMAQASMAQARAEAAIAVAKIGPVPQVARPLVVPANSASAPLTGQGVIPMQGASAPQGVKREFEEANGNGHMVMMDVVGS